MTLSHTAAFRAQANFPVEAKIKVGKDIWTPETAGSRLYTQVLSKNPATIQKVIDLAATLDAPFTSKQVMGHLKWLYTDGQLEVDGKSYVVEPKAKAEPKAEPKPAKAEAKKPEAKAVVAAKQVARKTKKAA